MKAENLETKMPSSNEVSKVKRVIFIPSNRIGDNLLLTPLFEIIKRCNRGIESVLLMDEQIFGLFENLTDQVIPVKLEAQYIKGWIRDNKKVHDLYVMPLYRDIPIFHEIFDEIKKHPSCLIFSGPSMDGKNNVSIDYIVSNQDQVQPVYAGITRGLLLLKPLLLNAGIELAELQTPKSLEILRPIVNPELFSDTRVRQARAKYGLPSNKYLIYVNMIATRATRIYDAESVRGMLKRVLDNYTDGRILVINQGRDFRIEETDPSMTEQEYASKATDGLSRRENIMLLDSMSIEDLTSVLCCCSEIITIDSGISHITSDIHFKGIPVTVFYTNKDKQKTWFFPGINRSSKYLDNTATGEELFNAIMR